MVDKFAGKWEMVDVTGLEDFLKGMGKDDMFKAILLKVVIFFW